MKNLFKIMTLMICIVAFFLTFWPTTNSFEKRKTIITEEEHSSEVIIAKKNVTITFYSPIEEQCDEDPLITADGSKIDLDKLLSGEIRWCAVSRDLLRVYAYGDEIWIESKNPNIRGYWTVKDTMASFKKNSIDLLLPENHKTGFGKEITHIKTQLPRYLIEELDWELYEDPDPQFLENTLSEDDGLKEEIVGN